jgi:6-phosphogluconolactonase
VVDDEDPSGRPRLTLTPPAIDAARTVLFLVIGAGKAEVLRAVREGPFTPELIPAKRIAIRLGRVVWIVDAAAARPR